MDPYKPPFPASEAKTSEQRKEWLKWYFDSMEHRNKQSSDFNNAASFWLLFGFFALTVVPLALAIAPRLYKLLF